MNLTKINKDIFKNGLAKNIITVDTAESFPEEIVKTFQKEGYVFIEINYRDYKHLNHAMRTHDILEEVQPRINFYNHCIVRVTTGGTDANDDFLAFYGEVISAIAQDIKGGKYSDITDRPSFLCI